MKPVNSGDYRDPITIQEEVFTKTPGTNEKESGWISVCTARAAIEPLRGREYFQAMETHSEQIIRIRMRYRQGITEAMRVVYGDQILYVQGPPIDPENRHIELHLMCVRNKPKGPGE